MKFCIKLAGVVVEIEHRYPYIHETCREFEVHCVEKPDFTVSVTDEMIRKEFEGWERIYNRTLDFELWKEYCESDSLIGRICDEIPFYGMFLMHAAVIAVDGVAYVFTAPSGTGKSTHIQLWKKLFGDRAVIVNGDNPLIRVADGKVYVCSTPWKGKEGWGLGLDAMFPVGGICIVEQNPENHIRRISTEEAGRHILKEVHLTRNREDSFSQFWDLLDTVMTTVDFYLLQCNRELAAAQLSYETMRRRQDAENEKRLSVAQIGR